MTNETDLQRLEREYVEAGYDLSLLEARLKMTPQERVEAHERALALMLALREAGEKLRARAPKAP